MNTTRLANVLFSLGEKIPEKRYLAICESIESDSFSLDECVFEYKKKDSIFNKVVFVLADSTKVMISEDVFTKLNSLNIDKDQLSKFVNENYTNFKQVVGTLNGNY